MHTPPIVVAVDGTDHSRAAVRWAAREAGLSNRPLLLVNVMDWDWGAARYDVTGQTFQEARRFADSVPTRAVQDAKAVAPAVEVYTDVLVGDPAAQLIIASEHAGLLVLGSRGQGGFAGLHLGSVSQRVAVHADSPVVVVRGRAWPGPGPIVVGLADTDSADEVLETAFAAARPRGTSLVVVHSCAPTGPPSREGPTAAPVHLADQHTVEQSVLTGRLKPWQDKYPDVPVRTVLSHESAAAAMVNSSHRAQLVVAGSRGRGMIAGTLLGSTGVQLLHHADCPVLIVRPHRRRISIR